MKRLKPLCSLGNGAFIPSLYRYLKDFDIIYLHYPFFGGAEIIWFFKLLNPKKKVIIRYHMDILGLSLMAKILSLPFFLVRNSLLKKADIIIVSSFDYIKHSSVSDFYKKYKNKFKEIPYGVDTNRFKPKKKEYKKINILFVGGLDKAHYFKGVVNLIEAIFLLKKEGLNNWNLKIAGAGDMEVVYKKRARFLGIEENIIFLGKVSDDRLPQLYAESHITVLPSINKGEAFGIVLLESMSSGTPVIASNLPGVRSVFKEGQDGLRVNPNDIEDLKKKLKELIKNKDKLMQMSKDARQTALNKYSFDKTKNSLMEALVS